MVLLVVFGVVLVALLGCCMLRGLLDCCVWVFGMICLLGCCVWVFGVALVASGLVVSGGFRMWFWFVYGLLLVCFVCGCCLCWICVWVFDGAMLCFLLC